MITKKVSYDHTITEDGQIRVREITRFLEDNKEVSKASKQHIIASGGDVSKEDERTKKLAQAITK